MMEVVKFKSEMRSITERLKHSGKLVGFVPTMGALHRGHLSLVQACRNENDITVASVFVNPTQFNDSSDLTNYPRMPEKDFALLESAGCDFIFYPNIEEMYPVPDTRLFDFGPLGNVMEGAHRPGHFNGVAQVVTKLFDAVSSNSAYFGEKDFQQLAIITQLVKDLKLGVRIVPCPIVREDDGLAMSSRNLLLGTNERLAAPLISQTLLKAKDLKPIMTVDGLKAWVVAQIHASPYLTTEYFEIVDDMMLQPVKDWFSANGYVGCIAVKAGNIRLIDNIRF